MKQTIKLLVDASIIIESYELHVWGEIVAGSEVAISPEILNVELGYYEEPQKLIRINKDEIKAAVKIVEPEVEDLKSVVDYFDDVFLERIDPGERELLALLKAGRVDDNYLLCTSDGPAIKALALLDASDRGISLEKLLNTLGFRKTIKFQFTDRFFAHKLHEGSIDRIQGKGLRR